MHRGQGLDLAMHVSRWS